MPERATLYAMAHRIWGAAGGLLTAALVASYFTPALQGYYYTFLGLLTLQTFVELGFGELLQQFVSHEWARTESSDAAVRERAENRLSALLRFSLAWYLGAALLLFAGLGIAGSVYFRLFAEPGELSWEGAWWLASFVTAASVLLTPLFALLEGKNRVEKVHGVRLSQGLLSRAAGFLAIPLGAGLLTIPITRGVSLLLGALGLGGEALATARRFWRRPPASALGASARLADPPSLLASAGSPEPRAEAKAPRRRPSPALSWKRELWPLQWKFGLSWLSGYVLYSLFTPVLFAFHGPVVAGQMGMTVAAASAISSAAFAVMATKVPRLALHAAGGEYEDMDALFRRATLSAIAVSAAGAAVFFGGLVLARGQGLAIAGRFLPSLETALLLGAVVLQQVRYAMGSYLRAHKADPFVLLSVGEALVAIPLLTLLGRSGGALAMILGFFGLTAATLVPAASIFARCRAAWHGPRLVEP